MKITRNCAVAFLAFLAAILSFGSSPAHSQCPNPASALCPHGFYMADIVLPEGSISTGTPFPVLISGGTGSSPVEFIDAQIVVEETTVRIESTFELGPWAMPSAWQESFEIPSLDPGSYSLEFLIWDDVTEEMVLNSTAMLQVQANSVPTLGRIGLGVLTCLIVIAGLALLGRKD